MKNMMERAKFVCGGEEGASNVEILIWIAVVLVVAIALFAFRDEITEFLGNSSQRVDQMNNQTELNSFGKPTAQ